MVAFFDALEPVLGGQGKDVITRLPDIELDTVQILLEVRNSVGLDLGQRLFLELVQGVGRLGLPALGEWLGGVLAIEIGSNGELECDLAHLLELKSAGICRWA